MIRPSAALLEAVQTNCHIADARHAQDLSLCTFLLQIREFHRWERGLPLNAPLQRAEVGAWIAQREALWAELEAREFLRLPLEGVDDAGGEPFETAPLNAQLQAQGLVYGAGWAGARRPGFFLAELIELRAIEAEGLRVQLCGREWARGLFAPPAVLAGDTQRQFWQGLRLTTAVAGLTVGDPAEIPAVAVVVFQRDPVADLNRVAFWEPMAEPQLALTTAAPTPQFEPTAGNGPVVERAGQFVRAGSVMNDAAKRHDELAGLFCAELIVQRRQQCGIVGMNHQAILKDLRVRQVGFQPRGRTRLEEAIDSGVGVPVEEEAILFLLGADVEFRS